METIQKYKEFIKNSHEKIVRIMNDQILPSVKDIVESYDLNLKKWDVYFGRAVGWSVNDLSNPENWMGSNLDKVKLYVELKFEEEWDDGVEIHDRIISEFGDDLHFELDDELVDGGIVQIYSIR